MTADRWNQIKRLFDEASKQPVEVHEAFVLAGADGDSEVYRETLAMLRHGTENKGGLLDLGMMARQWIPPAVVARTFAPGLILAGRYRIVRPIGLGGMGEVYEAEDLDLGARVAVKTMRIEDPDALARFKREIQLARTVTHPNVCRIFDMHRHHEPESGSAITFLTMELLEGQTLAAYLASSGPLTAAEALPLVRQIAAALTAAHECKVVHRDLKAGNVMLTADGLRAVVTDFGIAHPIAQATESTITIIGTPAYMAPEQFEGKLVTAAADIYAFGVLLYEVVVGRSPFAGETPIALALEKIRKPAPYASDAVPDLPLEWSAVIRRCLDPVPERRFATVKDALRPLEESVNRPTVMRLTRNQRKSFAAVLAIISLLAVCAWRYTHSAHTPTSEALRLYHLGIRTHQLGLPWKASQLFENALESDPQFSLARISLAEAWMDLDQPFRAESALRQAVEMRPRWRRQAAYEMFLEQAAIARLRGDLPQSALLHRQATAAAPETERVAVGFSEGRARVRGGDLPGAIKLLASLGEGPVCNGPAMLERAILSYPQQALAARLLFEQAGVCFENAADLDGIAQSSYQYANAEYGDQGHSLFTRIRHATDVAKSTGNIEQQIQIAALLSKLMLDTGDEEASYASFAEAMQLADAKGLNFYSARLLTERAEYFFQQGDFLHWGHYGALALSLSRSARMPLTITRCQIRAAKVSLRMNLPEQASRLLVEVHEQLKRYPDQTTASEVSKLTELIKHTPSRPEGTAYSGNPTASFR